MTKKVSAGSLIKQLERAYAEIAGHSIEEAKKYSKDKVVFRIDQKPLGLYFIKSGRVKIIREGQNGEEVILRIAPENDFIGYVSLIKRWDYTATAITTEPSEILFIPKGVFLKLLKNDIEFTREFVELICSHLYEQSEKISGLMDMDARQRFAVLLLSLEMAYDEDDRYSNSYVRLPRKDIAAAIGITPETVSRFLSQLKEKGILRTTDGIIEILNRSALLRMARIKD